MSNNSKVSLNKNSFNLNKIKQKIPNLKSANKLVVGVATVAILLIVGMIVYWIYNSYVTSSIQDKMNPVLISELVDARKEKNKKWNLPRTINPLSSNISFTISFWMYIDDWNYRVGEPKALLIKDIKNDNFGLNASPGFWLDKYSNNLITGIKVYDSDELHQCKISNIPVQKWVHVVYVVENRNIDIYVDCKLERSCILNNIPNINVNSPLFLFPQNKEKSPFMDGVKEGTNKTGFSGKFGSLRYFSSSLKPIDVARLCNEGPFSTSGVSVKKHEDVPEDNSDNCNPKPDGTDVVVNEEVDGAESFENKDDKKMFNKYKNTTRLNDDGRGNAIYLDRHDVNCNNDLMGGFNLVRNKEHNKIGYNYNCYNSDNISFGGVFKKNTNSNNDGGGNTIYLDRHNVDCGKNPISSFKLNRPTKNTIQYNYSCSNFKPTGKCTSNYTNWNDSGKGLNIYLDRHNVNCPTGSVLTQFKLETDHTNHPNQYRYKYNCCGVSDGNMIIKKSSK